jgi:hypothetical protein
LHFFWTAFFAALFASLPMLPLPSFAGGSSATSYWYGGSLHPLVVSRDGVDYRLIGKGIVEEVGSSLVRSYLLADRLGSVRVVSDDQGHVAQSLGYDDYGFTRIAGESSAAADVLLHLPLNQTVRDEASGDTVLSTSITYDAQGMRAERTVNAGAQGKGGSASEPE